MIRYLFIFLLLPLSGFTQNLYPIIEQAKWGAIDSAGKVIIQPSYQFIDAYQDGKAIFRKDGKYGVMTNTEEIVIPCLYKEISFEVRHYITKNDAFKKAHYYHVRTEDGNGLLNNIGKQLVAPKHEKITILDTLYYVAENGGKLGLGIFGQGLITSLKYNYISRMSYQTFFLQEDDKKAIVNSKGETIYEGDFELFEIKPKHVFVQPIDKQLLILDMNGKPVLKGTFQFPEREDFVKDKLVTLQGDSIGGIYSLERNEWVIQQVCQTLIPAGSNYIVSKDGDYGVIDANTNIAIPMEWDLIEYNAGLYRFYKNDRVGAYSENLKEVAPCQFDVITNEGKFWLAWRGSRFAIISPRQKLISSTKFHNILISDRSVKAYSAEALTKYTFGSNWNIEEKKEYTNVVIIQTKLNAPKAKKIERNQTQGLPIFTGNSRWFPDTTITVRNDIETEKIRFGVKDENDSIIVKPGYVRVWEARDSLDQAFRMYRKVKAGQSMPTLLTIPYTKRYDLINPYTGKVKHKNILAISVERKPVRGLANIRDGIPRLFSQRFFSKSGIGLMDTNYNILQERMKYIDKQVEGMRVYGYSTTDVKLSRAITKMGAQEYRSPFYSGQLESDKEFGFVSIPDIKFGYIDSLGSIVHESIYEDAKPFEKGIGLVSNEKHGAVNYDSVIVPLIYNSASVHGHNGNGYVFAGLASSSRPFLVDSLSNVTTSKFASISETPDGVLIGKEGKYYGILDPNDLTWIVQPKFRSPPKPLGDNVIYRGKKYGVADKNGNQLVEPLFKKIVKFEHGLVVFEESKKKGLGLPDGTKIIRARFDEIEVFENMVIARTNKLAQTYGHDGKLLSKKPFQAYSFDPISGNTLILKKGVTTISNKETKLKIKLKEVLGFKLMGESFVYRERKLLGLKTIQGKTILPAVYDKIEPYNENLLRVVLDGYSGLVTKSGKVILPCAFREIKSVFGDKFVGYRGKSTATFVDDKGKVLYKENFIDIQTSNSGFILCRRKKEYVFLNENFENTFKKTYKNANSFRGGYASIAKNDGWVIINTGGDELSVPSFSSLVPIAKNVFIAKKKESYGVYDSYGKLLVPVEFETIRLLEEGIFLLLKEGKIGYMEVNGKWLFNPFK